MGRLPVTTTWRINTGMSVTQEPDISEEVPLQNVAATASGRNQACCVHVCI